MRGAVLRGAGDGGAGARDALTSRRGSTEGINQQNDENEQGCAEQHRAEREPLIWGHEIRHQVSVLMVGKRRRPTRGFVQAMFAGGHCRRFTKAWRASDGLQARLSARCCRLSPVRA